jgi:tRNA (Thr-GGU) A37 N-methylase
MLRGRPRQLQTSAPREGIKEVTTTCARQLEAVDGTPIVDLKPVLSTDVSER